MRDKDIISILKHSEGKKQELSSLMFTAKIQNTSVENVSNLVADILNNLTKCFDYCANDIYEKYIPHHIEPKHKDIYFPFYKNQLLNKGNPISLLLRYKKVIYDYLLAITEKADNNELIEDTNIAYSLAREIRRLVNEDKHNKIIEVDFEGPSEVIAQSEIGNITIKQDNLVQNGMRVELFPNQEKTIKTVKSYRLVDNNKEVADFCWDSQACTQQILDKIYRKFFGTKIML